MVVERVSIIPRNSSELGVREGSTVDLDFFVPEAVGLSDTGKLELLESLQAKIYHLSEKGEKGLSSGASVLEGAIEEYQNVWEVMEPDVIGIVQNRSEVGDSDSARAMDLLYRQYAERIRNYFLRRYAGKDQVEDMTQEVFLKAWEKISKFEQRGIPFGAWLFTLAHNHMVDRVRVATNHEKRAGGVVFSLDTTLQVSDPFATKEIQRVDTREALEKAMIRLTPEQRYVLELRFLTGCSVAQTAEEMGKTEEAVKKLQARGLDALRRLLTDKRTGARRI